MQKTRLPCLLVLLALLASPALVSARPAPRSPGQAAAAGIPLDRPLRFERFTTEEGLSQNSILAGLQDQRGYLWFGTQDGLNRYDGYEFTSFKHDPEDPDSLGFNSVISLLEDHAGSIWVGTWGGGLDRYDPATGRFTHFKHDPQDPDSLAADSVPALCQDSQGRLWVGTNGGGLDLFDPQGGGFIHHPADPARPGSLSSSYISTILCDETDRLWIGTGGYGQPGAGLNAFDPATGQARAYRHAADDPATLSSDTLSAIVRAPDGALWIATGGYALSGGGLNRFDPATGAAVRFVHTAADPTALAGNDILNLLIDPSGVLWVALYGAGLDRLDLSRPERGFVHSAYNPFNPASLSSDQVWSLLLDHSGVMWVGTINGGLNKLNPQVQQFGLLRGEPGNPNSLSYNVIGPLVDDGSGGVWIGTYGGGLDHYQPATATFTHYPDPDNPTGTVMSIYRDSRGTLWLGSLSGLTLLDPATGLRTHYRNDPADPASLVSDAVSGVIEDAQGRIWVSSFGGLETFDRRTGAFTPVELPEAGAVPTLFKAKDGALWAGSWGGGLYRLDTATYRAGKVAFTRYAHDPQDPRSLSEDSVWSIYEDSAGALWIGTGGGLNRLDPATGAFKRYREKDGLPNDNVLCILADERHLWLSTNNGLARFDPLSETFRVFDVSDGMQSSEFDSGSCVKTQSGRMYFGGVNGVNFFQPAEIQDNPTPPPVVISTFRIFNEPVAVNLASGTPVRLSYRQNFISFEFTALDFRAPQKNRYQYRLEGFDRGWIDAGNRRYASYTNLGGGDYTFRVRAANNDGVWNEEGVSIPLHIEPPFYSTWWFAGLVILLVFSVVGAAIRFRFDLVRRQNLQLEAQVGERTAALREANALLEVEVEQRKRAEDALALKAERELRESEARFEAMFENAAIGIALMRLDRSLLGVNEAAGRLLGCSRDELLRLKIDDILHPDDLGQDSRLFEEMVAGKRGTYQSEKRCRHKNGEYLWTRLIFMAVRGEDGSPAYLIAMFEDIQEQKRAQEELDRREDEYLRQLEKRVWERTTELRQANEQLHQEIEQRVRAEAALAAKAADEAVSAERNRLARDLHDAVSQTLFSASLQAEVLPKIMERDAAEGRTRLEELRQLTRGALAEMRTLLFELRPNALTDIPLPDLLHQLAEATLGRARLPVAFSAGGQAKLPPDVQITLYRMVQEALNNAAKYSHAAQAAIDVRLTPDSVRITVVDDGVGFDPESIPSGHFGLKIMRERAESINARVGIYSEPGQGTQITFAWPAK